MALGIEKTKNLVRAGVNLSKQIATATEDGWQWTDTFGFVDEFAEILSVVKTWDELKAELADLTPEERAELYAYFVAEFDIPNDQIESFVEDALMLAFSIISLVEKWKALKTPPAEETPIV
jgi:hypothetical protein